MYHPDDARLIAAAPELVEALSALLAVLEYWWSQENSPLSGADTYDPMRAARTLLARIEGA